MSSTLLPRQTRARAAAAAAARPENDENDVPAALAAGKHALAGAKAALSLPSKKAAGDATTAPTQKRAVAAILGELQVLGAHNAGAAGAKKGAVGGAGPAGPAGPGGVPAASHGTKRTKSATAQVNVTSTRVVEKVAGVASVSVFDNVDPFAKASASSGSDGSSTTRTSSDEDAAVQPPKAGAGAPTERDTTKSAAAQPAKSDSNKENVEPALPAEFKDLARSEEEAVQKNRLRTQFWEYEHDEVTDPIMVFEYSSDIFEYTLNLEKTVMPSAAYCEAAQPLGEMTWQMRKVLIEWVIDTHSRFGLSPESLYLGVNLIDRFLSIRPVSLVKVQLVGMAALMIAAKFEEVMTPALTNYLALADNAYSEEELLRAERYILSTLGFNLQYPSPMNFLRRVSKADNYEITTRTLAKYLMELCILDHRFLSFPPSLIAAAAMYQSRIMLRRRGQKADWTSAFAYYSSYEEDQVRPVALLILEMVLETCRKPNVVYKKYGGKKFMKASVFAKTWVQGRYPDGVSERGASGKAAP